MMDREQLIKDLLVSDFISIRDEGNRLAFVDQSTEKIVGRVLWSCIEIEEE